MTIERVIAEQGLSTAPTHVMHDFMSENPVLQAALSDGRLPAWVGAALSSLRTRLPVPPTCNSFVAGSFFRPPGHKRCFYYSPEPLEPGASTGVIAFKGFEPLAPDYDALLDEMEHGLAPDWLSWGFPLQRRYAEHFALFENKPPCSSMIKEVEDQGHAAAEAQRRHLAAYGALARLPIPLLGHRFPDEQTAELLAKFRRHLSRRAYERIATLARGFGGYIYYYGALPLRIKDYNATVNEVGFHESLDALAERVDLEEILDRWITLYVRILYLGYLPAALQTKGQGNLLLSQNAVLDGGYVDVDSLTPVEELDDPVFFDSLQFSHWVLFLTVRELLMKTRTPSHRGAFDYPDELIMRYLDTKIRERLATERVPEHPVDERIADYFRADLSFAALSSKLTSYFPRPPEKRIAPSFPRDLVVRLIVKP